MLANKVSEYSDAAWRCRELTYDHPDALNWLTELQKASELQPRTDSVVFCTNMMRHFSQFDP